MGALVLRGLQGATRLELLLMRFLIGCIGWVAIFLFLGIFGWINVRVIQVLVYVLAIGSSVRYGKGWWNEGRGAIPLDWTNITLGVILIAQALFALRPVTAFDALLYHLPVARRMLDTGTISWTPFIMNSSFPQNCEIMQSIGLAIGGDASASLVSWWFAVGAVLTLIALGRRLGSWRLGVWAGVVLSLTPIWFYLGHVPYIESCFAFGIALLSLTIVFKGPGWMMGAVLGWLAGSKINGIEIGIIGLLIWLWQARPGLRQTLTAVLISIAIAGFWYIRNLYLFADPVFPYFQDFFRFLGSPRAWGASDAAWDVKTQFDMFSSPATIKDWLIFPVKIIFYPSPEYTESDIVALRYVGLFSLPWLPSVLYIRKRPGLSGIYALILIDIALWVFVHKVVYLRFIAPLLPLMYLMGLIAMAEWFSKLRIGPKPMRIIAAVAVIGALAHLEFITPNRSLLQLPLWSGERDFFLEANIDGWPIIRELNKLEPRPVVYFVYGEGVRHYCEFPLYANWHDPYDFRKFGGHAASGAELAAWLGEIGVDVLLINKHRMEAFGYPYYDVLDGPDFTEVYIPQPLAYKDVSMFVRRDSGIKIDIEAGFSR